MRKVVAYELLSLDGVAEQPDEFVTDFDHVMRENLGRVQASVVRDGPVVDKQGRRGGPHCGKVQGRPPRRTPQPNG